MSNIDGCPTCKPWPYKPCPIHASTGHGERCSCAECFKRVDELLDGRPPEVAFAVVDEVRALVASEVSRDLQATEVFARMREVAHGRR